jgi:phage terminase large subunit
VSDPVGYCRDVLGFEPWSKQIEVLEAVRDHRRVAVRSCHGVGKTATAALACSGSTTRSRPRLPRDLDRPDVQGRERPPLARGPRASTPRRRPRSRRSSSTRGSSAARSGSRRATRPTSRSGSRATTPSILLLIVDEASGVDEAIFEAAEGFLTNENARVLLIGNPTQPPASSTARSTASGRCGTDPYQRVRRAGVHRRAGLGAGARRRSSPASGSRRSARSGARTRRSGRSASRQLPSPADDTVCALGDVESAQARLAPRGRPLVIACDVARFGSDETVITVRHGNRVRIAPTYVGQDTMRTVGEILEVAPVRGDGIVYLPASLTPIVVDDTGVGGGVTDRLREIERVPRSSRSTPASRRSSRTTTRTAAASSGSRSRTGCELDLDPDEQLAADLVAPRYKLDSRGRRVVEPKERRRSGSAAARRTAPTRCC